MKRNLFFDIFTDSFSHSLPFSPFAHLVWHEDLQIRRTE